jgi:uncharacterized membrane protein
VKLSDIEKLVDAGYLTRDQQEQINQQFGLHEEGSRFLAIISTIGAVLVAAGILLLIASNWENIPRLLKVATGIGLMAGAHAGGYYFRESTHRYPKTGDALHLIGAILFLANIALVGQIYHLPGSPPDAILLWWIGIAAFPWLLRSRALHILFLLAVGLWVLLNAADESAFLSIGPSEWLFLLAALLGLLYYAAGYFLFRTPFDHFASPTQKLGLLAFHLFSFPMTWGFFFNGPESRVVPVFLVGYALVAVLLLAGVLRERRLTLQWRCAWGGALVAVGAVLVGALIQSPGVTNDYVTYSGYHWFISLALFAFCLLQLNFAILIQSPFYLNLGVAFVALHIISIYINLIGSMAQTGLMFVISGIFLLVFGVYLERKRRALMRHMRNTPAVVA